MMSCKVETFLKNEYELGEGPHWDDSTNTLLTVDITRSDVVRWDPVKLEAKRIRLPDDSVGAVVPIANSNDLLVAAKTRFAIVDGESGNATTVEKIPVEAGDVRFNDGKCDPHGRFLAGTMGEETAPAVGAANLGKLFTLDRDLNMSVCLPNVDLSNGLAWTSDGQKMFYIDSYKFNVRAYDYDVTTGAATNPQVVVTFDRETHGIPDGMCIDADGNIYVALFFGGKVAKVNPTTGKIVQEIHVENAPKTTSVCFGGENYQDLYVTSAHNYFKWHGDGRPLGNSGSLFKVTGLGVKGFHQCQRLPSKSFIKGE